MPRTNALGNNSAARARSCPSRSSTHAREDGGGVTRVRAVVARRMDGGGETSRSTSEYSEQWMRRERISAQHLRQCMPVSTPDQTPGPSLFCCVSLREA